MKVLEFQSLGLPVIVSNRKNLKDYFGNTVLYEDPNDPKKIGSKIDKLLNDKKLYKKLRNRGLEFVKDKTWSSQENILNQFYEKSFK